jgi:hypothetical protein
MITNLIKQSPRTNPIPQQLRKHSAWYDASPTVCVDYLCHDERVIITITSTFLDTSGVRYGSMLLKKSRNALSRFFFEKKRSKTILAD